MSVDVDAGLGSRDSPPSWEELGHKMYSKQHVKYHTEIQKPDPMSVADTYAAYVRKYISDDAGSIFQGHLKNYRENMVAFKRKRAGETERMVQANNQSESIKKGVKELMIGSSR